MYLAIPARVVEVLAGDRAVVNEGGERKDISLELLDDVRAGDYVIVYAGFALNRIAAEDAERALAMFAEMGDFNPAGFAIDHE